jgi:hypothetical protein
MLTTDYFIMKGVKLKCVLQRTSQFSVTEHCSRLTLCIRPSNLNKVIRGTSQSLQVSSGIVAQIKAVPWLSRLVAGLSPRRPGFDPGSVHVRFVVDKVALGQVFLRVVGFPLSISFHWCSINCKTW